LHPGESGAPAGRWSACVRLLGILCLLLTAQRAHATGEAGSFCASCELQLGIGGTYHFWNTTHGILVPVTFNFDDGRYELGAFRFVNAQSYFSDHFHGVEHNANPYWGFSAVRRFAFFRHEHWRLLLGLGGSYKTEEDTLSASRWNFDEQLSLRLTPAKGLAIEIGMRHWSNGGLKLPNHGQDFATLTVSVWPALWR
jgi:hypothetical protein